MNYKFNGKSYLYKTFANFITKNENFCRILESYDIIIPVPISKKRNKERGYNQTDLIAKEISKQLDIELVEDCLYKSKNIVAQSTLSREERAQNIKDAYAIFNIEKLKNKKVLILDDIFTTGSTVNECCKMLRMANVRELSVLTIAKD